MIYPSSLKSSKVEFLNKLSNFNCDKFNNQEISLIKRSVKKEKPHIYLSPLSTLDLASVKYDIIFDVYIKSDDLYHVSNWWIIIKKLQDEWFVIEERPKKSIPKSHSNYHIADGMDQLVSFLNWIQE